MRWKHRIVVAGVLSIAIAVSPARAYAWGNEDHEIIALIAQNFLSAAARQKVDALLTADTDTITAHDIRLIGNSSFGFASLKTRLALCVVDSALRRCAPTATRCTCIGQ
jgi:hypothetical protein